jgi:VanZ family protein
MFPLKAAGRLAAWTCIGAIAVLSLIPGDEMIRTSVGGHIEHAVAYAGTSFLVAAAYGRWRRVVAGLLVYAGALEMLQHFSPGRTPSVVDYLFSAIGVVLGVAALGLLARVLPQLRRN